MKASWIRRRPGPEDDVRAAALALGAGAVVAGAVFYLARHVLAREWVDASPPDRRSLPPRAGEAE